MGDFGRTLIGSVNYYTSSDPDNDRVHGIVKLQPSAIDAGLPDSVTEFPGYNENQREVAWFDLRSRYDVDQAVIDLFGDDYTIE